MIEYEQVLKDKIEELEEQVKYYKYDDLTGLQGRKDFKNRLIEAWNSGVHFHLILIDINGLHNVNSKKGYDAGDKLIKRAVSEIIECNPTRKTEDIYRFGGDEFAIIFEYDNDFHSVDINCPSEFFILSTKCSVDYESYDELFFYTDQQLIERKAEYYKNRSDRRIK
jgi:diguanylate cyclase (GGDEF)-like protein